MKILQKSEGKFFSCSSNDPPYFRAVEAQPCSHDSGKPVGPPGVMRPTQARMSQNPLVLLRPQAPPQTVAAANAHSRTSTRGAHVGVGFHTLLNKSAVFVCQVASSHCQAMIGCWSTWAGPLEVVPDPLFLVVDNLRCFGPTVLAQNVVSG